MVDSNGVQVMHPLDWYYGAHTHGVVTQARKEQWDEATMGKWDTIYEQRILKRTQARQARRNAVTSLARKEFDG